MQEEPRPGADPGLSEGRAAERDVKAAHAAYWRKNRRLSAVLLGIWAFVSYGLAILFPMAFPIGKLPAGFWWAQQGSMFVFVILIFVYARRMDRLDRSFDVDEREPRGGGGPAGGEGGR